MVVIARMRAHMANTPTARGSGRRAEDDGRNMRLLSQDLGGVRMKSGIEERRGCDMNEHTGREQVTAIVQNCGGGSNQGEMQKKTAHRSSRKMSLAFKRARRLRARWEGARLERKPQSKMHVGDSLDFDGLVFIA
jgi:hypothetical protein